MLCFLPLLLAAQDPASLEKKARDVIDGYAYPNFKRDELLRILDEIRRLPTDQNAPILARLIEYVGEAIESTTADIHKALAAAGQKKGASEAERREIESEEKRAAILKGRFGPLLTILSDTGLALVLNEPTPRLDEFLRAGYQHIPVGAVRLRLVASLSKPRLLSCLVCVEKDPYVVAQIAGRLRAAGWASEAAVEVLLKHAADYRNFRRCRMACLKALVDVGKPSTVPALIELLKDPTAQDLAHEALVKITGENRGPAHEEWIARR